MESDQRGLVRAIIERPEDDAPRWIYADWLDEHDEPDMAELIRIALALPELRSRIKRTDDYMAVAEIETTLRYALEQRFGGGARLSYHRGLFHGAWIVRTDLAWFTKQTVTLLRYHPMTRLELHGGLAKDVAGLVELPELEQIRELSLNMECDDINLVAQAFLASPYLLNIKKLELRESYVLPPPRRRSFTPPYVTISVQLREQLMQRFGAALVWR